MSDKPTIESAIYHLQCEGYVEEAGLVGRLQGQIDELVIAVQAAVCELEAQINYRAPMTARCVERVVAHLNAALEPS